MGDMSDNFHDMRELRKKRHEEWERINLPIIEKCEFKSEVSANGTIMFRIEGKPYADFYPTTGRWQVCKTHVVMTGGAEAFLKWFRESNKDIENVS